MSSVPTFPTRQCSCCGIIKPLDADHFYRRLNGFQPVCKGCACEWHRQYYAANRDQMKADVMEDYWRNRGDILARRKARWLALSEEEREDYRARQRIYRRHRYATREAVRIAAYLYCALRRAREMVIEGLLTSDDIHDRFVAQEAQCAYCGADITDGFHRDHITPVVRNGSNWPENICLACGPCNLSKGAMTAEEFRAKRTAHR